MAVPPEVRPALRALWDLDLAFADVVSTTLTPQLGAIRLAWWRERLEELDHGVGPPPEPRLQALAATLIPSGISGAELAQLEFCWLALLSPFPWDDLVADALALRGAILFGTGARLLGRPAAEGEPYGRFWSLVDGARHCSDAQSRDFLFDHAKAAMGELSRLRAPSELYPLTMIAGRRAVDLKHGRGDVWRRLVAWFRFSLFGTFPGS